MQTSYTSNDWNEDPVEERLRAALNKDSQPELIRKLYPFRAKVGDTVANGYAYGYPTGYVFMYARTKQIASRFPIEVWSGKEPGRTLQHGILSVHHFDSKEVSLIMPAEGE